MFGEQRFWDSTNWAVENWEKLWSGPGPSDIVWMLLILLVWKQIFKLFLPDKKVCVVAYFKDSRVEFCK